MAFTEMPPDSVNVLLKTNRFTHDLWENLHEIYNISCRIFSLRKERQIRLAQLFQSNRLPNGLKSLLQKSNGDLFDVSIEEYGTGTCLIFQTEPSSCFPSRKPVLYDDFDKPEPSKNEAKEEPALKPNSKNTPAKSSLSIVLVIVGVLIAVGIFIASQS